MELLERTATDDDDCKCQRIDPVTTGSAASAPGSLGARFRQLEIAMGGANDDLTSSHSVGGGTTIVTRGDGTNTGP